LLVDAERWLLWPRGTGRPPVPPEVPPELAADYSQACLIVGDSPKAAAALARGCLQHLLRTAAGVKPSDLVKEIQQVLDGGQLPSWLAEHLDAVRNIGNFAAHPIKSTTTGEIVAVEPGEAEWALDVLDGVAVRLLLRRPGEGEGQERRPEREAERRRQAPHEASQDIEAAEAYPRAAGAAELVGEGVAAETRLGYAGDLGRYGAWCAERALPPVAASAERLVNYVAYLAAKGKAPSSIDRALAAILSAHRLAGAPWPDTKGARAAIRALRRRRAEAGAGPRRLAELIAGCGRADGGSVPGNRPRIQGMNP